MKMDNEILEKIRTFIYDSGLGYTLPYPFSFKKKNIGRETRLIEDLKIDGDDADEFLISFGKEFNVDVSKFRIDEYFGDEEDAVVGAINNYFRANMSGRKTLTVSHLEKAVISGRLDEEIINS